jgi:Flp pilus assembly protein TadB
MSNDEKQRFSARVKTDTLEKIEAYQDDNALDNRSAAIDHMVEHYEEKQQAASRWDTIAEQALFAATLSVLAGVLSLISLVVAVFFTAYPSPLSVVLLALVFGATATAFGGAVGHRYARSKSEQVFVDGVEA